MSDTHEMLGMEMRSVNRRIVAARREFRNADTIPDHDRVLTQGNIEAMRDLLTNLEEALR